MHRHITLIFALSLLFTIVLPIHALAGNIESHGNLARMHSRMLKKRANSNNPIAALLGNPDSQASSGDGGAANVESGPVAQPQSGNPSTSDGAGDNTSGQSNTNGGTTANNGAGSANDASPSTGNANSGNTGSTTGNANGETNQSGNPSDNNPQQGGIVSVVTGLLGNPKSTSTSSSTTSSTTAAAANSTSATSANTSTTKSLSSTASSTPTSTPSTSPTSSSSSSSLSLPTSDSTSTSATSSTSPSQTAPPNEDDSNNPSNTSITRNTIIILVAIGASVGVAAIVWTVIRKWKFRPSSNFEGRMQPIDWQPTTHDDGDIIANRLNRNASTRSHGSFTSGNGHSGANDNSLVADLPPLDAIGGSSHLAPVGGYANLQRGPSPQPMFELSNPHQYPISQQQYYNSGQGTAYGY